MERMLLLPLFAELVFVIPYLSAAFFREQIIMGMIVFLVLSCIYVFAMLWSEEKYAIRCSGSTDCMEPGDANLSCEKNVHSGRKWIDWLNLIRLGIRLTFYLCLTYGILAEAEGNNQTAGESRWIPTIVPLLSICIYGATLRLEQQGRMYELLFWLLFVPFLFVMVFGIQHVEAGQWVQQLWWGDMDGKDLWRVCYLLPFLLPVELVCVLRPRVRENSGFRRLAFAILGTVLLAVIFAILMIVIYGLHGAAQEEMLTVAVLRCIRLPFQLSQRLDALLIWFFLVGCFVLISQTLFFERYIAGAMMTKRKSNALLTVIFLCVIIVSYRIPDYQTALQWYCRYGVWVDFPLSFILPLLKTYNS